jgi:iron-sulfur cluster insertion protein
VYQTKKIKQYYGNSTMPDGHIDTVAKKVTLSDSAVERLKVLGSEAEHADQMLRVAVDGGGCSGFKYSFTFDGQINDDDKVIEKNGISVLIDEMSWDYLAGSEIDYKQELIGSYFSIENPNAASTCGCGTSFALL